MKSIHLFLLLTLCSTLGAWYRCEKDLTIKRDEITNLKKQLALYMDKK